MQASPPPLPTRSTRQDLFLSNWTPDPPPPALTPPRTPSRTPPLSIPRRAPYEPPPAFRNSSTPPPPSFGFPTPPAELHTPQFHKSPPSSKTSLFFSSAGDSTPPPAPRLRDTSPSTSLSRKASVRSARSHTSHTSQALSPPEDLTPLHQSPSLAPTVWSPPHPPTEDITLRFTPEPRYLLGEGRYASVYLASYRKPLDTEWTLCAAKRLAPDRESQTMGLREAFFLNRLTSRKGSVYIVKLIAVRDDDAVSGHTRTTSEQVDSPRRVRSSTIYAGGRQDTGSHPSLPALLDHPSPAASRLVLVLEHAPLGTLDRLLRSSPSLVGPELWGRWAREASDALAWVHDQGIVHSDVKPANLLLTTDLHIRISDFGSSLLIHPEHPPTDGVGLGTLPFSAPELVDPTTPFGFAVDIFALGATLYQCITGREPYRGLRPVEMIHHVRRGGLWSWAERERLARIGAEESAPASPYPSAWRAEVPTTDTGVKRSGSLRVPLQNLAKRPILSRVGSAESLRASADAVNDSPAGVRMWAEWQRGGGGGIELLLSDVEGSGSDGGRSSTPASPLSPRVPWSPTPNGVPYRREEGADGAAYEDGSPAMFYLGGGRVADGIREVLRSMLEAEEEERPTAAELVKAWEGLGVGVGE